MPPGSTPITDLVEGRARLRRRGHGLIVTSRGRFEAVHLRFWPKLVALPELWPVGPRYHARGDADRCRLYFNQPRRFPNFLALKYVVSTAGTSYATFRKALAVLDAIAEIKGIDAIVCDAANLRLSDRLLGRLGWEPHKPQRWHRNFIRRFYGKYPRLAEVEGGAAWGGLPMNSADLPVAVAAMVSHPTAIR